MQEDYPRLEPLLASLLKMLSTYSSNPQPTLAKMISRQFEIIASHPEAEELTLLKNVSKRLQVDWIAKGTGALPCEFTRSMH